MLLLRLLFTIMGLENNGKWKGPPGKYSIAGEAGTRMGFLFTPPATVGPADTITVARFMRVSNWVHESDFRRFDMLPIFQNYVVTLLRDKGGANAVEYALIMALVAVFIIAGVLAMSGAIGTLFNSMASCLGDAPNCNTGTF